MQKRRNRHKKRLVDARRKEDEYDRWSSDESRKEDERKQRLLIARRKERKYKLELLGELKMKVWRKKDKSGAPEGRRPTNDVVRDGDPIILRNKDILTKDTRTQGQYELAGKEVLLELRMLAWYEGIKFEIPRSEKSKKKELDVYPVDLVTNLFVRGKQVIIEFHGADGTYLNRMSRWREAHGDRFYYILIKSCLENASEASVEMNPGGRHGDHVNELWTMQWIRKRMKGGAYDSIEFSVWKERMRAELIKFMRERADNCDDWEVTAALINVRREH